MNKQTKENWSSTNFKYGKDKNNLLDKANNLLCKFKGNEITDETLNGLITFVQFMSPQYDNFGQQLKALIFTNE